jgi:hypothetical protein
LLRNQIKKEKHSWKIELSIKVINNKSNLKFTELQNFNDQLLMEVEVEEGGIM